MWFWECKGNKSNISIDPLIYIMFTVLEFHSLFFPPPPSPPCFDFISRKTVYDENRSWRMICGGCLLPVRLTEHWLASAGWSPGLLFAGLLSGPAWHIRSIILPLPQTPSYLLTWLRCYVAQILLRWVSWLSYPAHTPLIAISVTQS